MIMTYEINEHHSLKSEETNIKMRSTAFHVLFITYECNYINVCKIFKVFSMYKYLVAFANECVRIYLFFFYHFKISCTIYANFSLVNGTEKFLFNS